MGKDTTRFSAIKVDMVDAGANWVDCDVFQDGNLITSRTPDDLPAFPRTLIASCEGHSEAAIVPELAHHAG